MSNAIFVFALVLHALLMLVDEFYFHWRRGLPRWERWGHPLDTLTVIACFALAKFLPNTSSALPIYIGACIFSSLFITKDEWVHHRECNAGEQWLHSLLFMLHLVLLTFAWVARANNVQFFGVSFLSAQLIVLAVFGAYQFLYWNVLTAAAQTPSKNKINTEVYNTLGNRWYTADNDPIALLRSESKTIAPWILEKIHAHTGEKPTQILDIGCGAGFLANKLAHTPHQIFGLDLSNESLQVAREFDATKKVTYLQGNAYELPFENEKFEVVCMLDFLEHIENVDQALKEVSRVLKPQGLFFFHTFNRNPVSWLVALKGVEWFVQNTPENLHLYRLFRKPKELQQALKNQGLEIKSLIGLKPVIFSKAFFKLLFSGRVCEEFQFRLTPSMLVSYLGVAVKNININN